MSSETHAAVEEQATHLHANGSTAAILAAGDVAPDFCLKSTPDQSVSLNEFRGQPVVLAFYPADWSPVCGDQRRSTTKSCPTFMPWTPLCWASRWTAPGATRRSRGSASCIFRF